MIGLMRPYHPIVKFIHCQLDRSVTMTNDHAATSNMENLLQLAIIQLIFVS